MRIGCYLLSGDDYPHRIPKRNDEERMRVYKEAGEDGLRGYLGTKKEIDFDRINEVLAAFHEGKERIEKRYTEAIDAASACYLFGIREFNNTPKLLFNDLRLREECRDLKKCFSIDAKTSIDCSGTEPKSNPRTYKAVRKGMEFDGEIEFYHFDEEICQKCKKYLIQNLEKFNDGIYRLGGSKSRGYGKIHVSILEDGREDSEEL